MRNHLHGVTEEIATAFFGDDRGVDLAGGDIGLGGQVDVEESFVVADVEIGFGAVFGDEDLTVLEGVHGAGINVEVRIQLLHGHTHAAGHQQAAQARSGEPLAERGDNASGYEYMLGLRRVAHGPPA